LRTFVRRHRLGVMLGAAMALALLTFSFAMVRETRRTERAYQQAERERIRAERVTAMLTQLFQPADPEAAAAAPSPSARELLDRAAERVPIELAEEPAVRVSLDRTLGVIYRNLGLLEPAVALLRRSLESAAAHYGSDHPETLAVQHELAIAYFERGDLPSAETLYVRLRGAYQARDVGDEQRLGRVLNDLGVLRFVQQDHEAAAALLEEALVTRRGLGMSADHAETLHNLGLVEAGRKHLARGESLLREGLVMRRGVFGDAHMLVANSLVGIARLRLRRDDPADAERLAREALVVMETLLTSKDWRIAVVQTLRGRSLVALARFDEAESVLLEAYGNLQNHAGRGSRPMTQARAALASLYEARGDVERAEAFRDPA
jgi:tetratricopeptide (TPR) repeat protein